MNQNQRQGRRLPYHPLFIEPVHCVGCGNCDGGPSDRNRFGFPRVKESEDDIPYCNCAINFHDYTKDSKEPKVNPCKTLKCRLCATLESFVPIPFEKPQITFSDFTVPDEWKIQNGGLRGTQNEEGEFKICV